MRKSTAKFYICVLSTYLIIQIAEIKMVAVIGNFARTLSLGLSKEFRPHLLRQGSTQPSQKRGSKMDKVRKVV